MDAIERFSDIKLTRSEIADMLQPVMDLHGIEITEESVRFPGVNPCHNMFDDEKPADTPATVCFEEIASVSYFTGRVEVLLHSGYLYIFSTTDNVRTCVNTHAGSSPTEEKKRPTTAQDIAKNIWEALENTLAAKK